MKLQDKIKLFLNERLGTTPESKGLYVGHNNDFRLFKNLNVKELKKEGIDNMSVRILVDIQNHCYYIADYRMFHDEQISIIKKEGISLSNDLVRIKGKISGNILKIEMINDRERKSEAYSVLKNYGIEVKE